jgi:hypothetical protein
MSNQNQEQKFSRYPFLEALLAEKGLSLKGTYTNRDVANVFEVSVRTIQEWSSNGGLKPRMLPGRARFLSGDLEEFLRSSAKPRHERTDAGDPRYIGRNRLQPPRAAK